VVDSEVVALTGARQPYLHALLEIAAARRALPVPAPLFLVESQLAQRIASLVKEVRMSKPRLIASLVIALAVLVGTGWWAARTFWLAAPLGAPTHMVGYGVFSAPGSDVPSYFMLCVVEDDRAGASGIVGRANPEVKCPVPLSTPMPPYTSQAKDDKVQGAVVTAVDVDVSGNVAGVKLTAVSLSRNLSDGLDESVIETLRTWKFKPAMRQGKPVPAEVRVQVDFHLS